MNKTGKTRLISDPFKELLAVLNISEYEVNVKVKRRLTYSAF